MVDRWPAARAELIWPRRPNLRLPFTPPRAAALASLRQSTAIASDETGVRIEGRNGHHWVFASAEAVVHQTAMSRGAKVAREVLGGQPAIVSPVGV